MRKPLIAGNWKMFKNRDEALQFVYSVIEEVPNADQVESVICAPLPFLRCLVKRQGQNLRIGAQNMHFEVEGAYTGEVSAPMLTSIGVEYVVVGHSERRAMFNETDETVNKKIHQALAHKITPIVCVGEELDARETKLTENIIKNQLVLGLAGLDNEQITNIVIAYEPIWAIGTGKTATPEMADETCGFIRNTVAQLYTQDAADKIRILYGGSVKVGNIQDLMAKENIDGALIGGASLIAPDFIKLTKAAL